MSKFWLYSALVSKDSAPGKRINGHRAGVWFAESKEEVAGTFTLSSIEDGYSVDSISINELSEDIKIKIANQLNVVKHAWKSMDTAPRDGTSVLLLHKIHGQIEGRFEPGRSVQYQESVEWEGDVWILGDDITQEEVENYGVNGYHDGNIIAWTNKLDIENSIFQLTE